MKNHYALIVNIWAAGFIVSLSTMSRDAALLACGINAAYALFMMLRSESVERKDK